MPVIIRYINGKFVASRPLSAKTAIVSYADGRYTHVPTKLIERAAYHNPNIDVFVFRSPSEIGSPPHKDNPYAFKVYAIDHVRRLGYTTILWCDSCLRPVRPLESLLDTIQQVGVYFQKDGWMCGEWANDRALAYFGKTRDDAMTISTVYACFMGFDFTHPRTQEFFSRWKKACDDGVFRGEWTNAMKSESQDPRCKGHRHDQTSVELIANEMSIPLFPCVFSYDTSDSSRYFTGWDKP